MTKTKSAKGGTPRLKVQPILIPTQRVTPREPQWPGDAGDIKPSSKGDPCKTTRRGCPVQLIFRQGEAFLRVCTTSKRPGRLVPVSDPSNALAVGEKICACWAKNGKSFDKCGLKRRPLGRSR